MSVVMKAPPTNDISEFSLFRNIRYEHLVAGISGGVVSTLMLHPFDVVKIRFAVNNDKRSISPKYSSIWNAFSTIFREEKIRGLYRGVLPNALGSGASWGFYFLFYNDIKTYMQKGNVNEALKANQHLIAAVEAGVLTVLLTNPIWITKTRLILQYDQSVEKEQYKGVIDAWIKIYKSEGFRGYYKGLIPGLIGVSHGAVQFVVYEKMKNEYQSYRNKPISSKLDTAQYLYFAAISKIAAAILTYPYQVVRARLQNQHYMYEGNIHCIRETWAFEGWRGFYKGLGTNLIKVIPATMITFVVYEHVQHFLIGTS